MKFDAVLFGWSVWWVLAANATLLFLWLVLRLVTLQPPGRVLPWMTGALTVVAVWFFVNDGWSKLHLVWLYPSVSLAVAALIAAAG